MYMFTVVFSNRIFNLAVQTSFLLSQITLMFPATKPRMVTRVRHTFGYSSGSRALQCWKCVVRRSKLYMAVFLENTLRLEVM